MALHTDYCRPGERASAVGLWYMSAGVGTLIAYMAGGYIAQHYGWRWVFIAAGIPGILIAIVLLLTVREPVRGGMDDDAKADSKTNEEGRSEEHTSELQSLMRNSYAVFC